MAKNKGLKVGLVLDTSLDPPDGVQQYVISVGEWLRSQGHNVHYLVGQTEHRQLPNIHSLTRNFKVRFNGNRTTIPLPTSKKKLRKFLQQEHFDILHVQVPHNPFMAQPLINAANKKTAVVGTFHILPYGKLAHVANHALGLWLRPSLKRFDQMLAVSPAAAKFAKATFKTDSLVIPNAFDYKRFHEAKPFDKYSKDDRLTILFLGRLVRRKGCGLLLRAIATLVEENRGVPPFRVVVCGKGHEELKLREFVDYHNMTDFVEFTGFVSEEDKPRYYASADLSVFPSSGGESFGIVLLEAMASGQAAVLAGDNPGYRSVLESQADLLFDPHDATLLADKLEKYLKDAKLRKTIAGWGETYTRDFDTAVVGSQLLEVYENALRKRSKL